MLRSQNPFILLLVLSLAMPAYSLSVVEARHLSLRAGFGAETSLVRSLMPLSKKEAVLFLSKSIDDDFIKPSCANHVLKSNFYVKSLNEKERKILRRSQRTCNRTLKSTYVQHLIKSDVDVILKRRLELFWHNHFTVSLKKVSHAALIYDQHHLIHKYAFGDFRVFLSRMLLDPAMLLYLDNSDNIKARPNENFARELMELFTLGVGGYSEDDVKEVSRALTGMSIDPRSYVSRFFPERHDYGSKTILGESGMFGVGAVAEILLKQKLTARHITNKLWLEFVSKADDAEITRLSEQFYKDWNVLGLVRSILMSEAFWNDNGKMIKSPLELVVGGSRMLPGMVPSKSVPALMRRMGQDLFDPPNVKGWPSGNGWITSQTYIERIKFGELLTRGLQPQRYKKELAYICADGGPAKLAALPVDLESATPTPSMKDDVAGVKPAEAMVLGMANKASGVLDGEKDRHADYSDMSECVDALANLLENPVWQLK